LYFCYIDISLIRKLLDTTLLQWSEGDKSLYKPFLEKQGKDNVTVAEWKEGECNGDWCGEQYAKQREVTFNFYKQTIGKTLVDVKHTQQLRRESDRCIVQIKMAMSGKLLVIYSQYIYQRMPNLLSFERIQRVSIC